MPLLLERVRFMSSDPNFLQVSADVTLRVLAKALSLGWSDFFGMYYSKTDVLKIARASNRVVCLQNSC